MDVNWHESLFNITNVHKLSIGLGLWCLMLLSTIFQIHRGRQFYWLKNIIKMGICKHFIDDFM
jgi:hypothetical protein